MPLDYSLTFCAKPVSSGFNSIQSLQNFLQQAEVIPIQIQKSDLDFPAQGGFFERPYINFCHLRVVEAERIDQPGQLRQQDAARWL